VGGGVWSLQYLVKIINIIIDLIKDECIRVSKGVASGVKEMDK